MHDVNGEPAQQCKRRVQYTRSSQIAYQILLCSAHIQNLFESK